MKTQSIFAVALLASAGIVFGPARICAQAPAGVGASQSPDTHTPPSNPTPQDKTRPAPALPMSAHRKKPSCAIIFSTASDRIPIAGAIIVAGINQADNTPPEWGGGMEAFGKRVGSNYGINAISTTTRYGLSEILHQDTLYYRCGCKGFFPRLGHALVSTLAARHGEDGRYTFSVPALVAPYAGTMVATHTWFPGRYNSSDAFRMGNYNLLALAGGNVAIEFLYHGPHSFLSRIHMNNTHAAPEPDR